MVHYEALSKISGLVDRNNLEKYEIFNPDFEPQRAKLRIERNHAQRRINLQHATSVSNQSRSLQNPTTAQVIHIMTAHRIAENSAQDNVLFYQQMDEAVTQIEEDIKLQENLFLAITLYTHLIEYLSSVVDKHDLQKEINPDNREDNIQLKNAA